jgi:hypothetical protein
MRSTVYVYLSQRNPPPGSNAGEWISGTFDLVMKLYHKKPPNERAVFWNRPFAPAKQGLIRFTFSRAARFGG